MKGDNLRLQVSKDGSHTLFSENFNASYHSIHGALQESNHVFIEHGLNHISKFKSEVSVFEVGFGTGLNTALSAIYAKEHELKIEYTTIEAYPISLDLVEKLNYYSVNHDLTDALFQKIHRAEWNQWIIISEHFNLYKIDALLEDGIEGKFDLIYFDAFASSTQSELWTPGIFLNMYRILNADGVLVTYAATGKLKRLLKACGFVIEALPGPPGKREMTRATKPAV